MSPDNAWMALQGIETLPMAPTRRPFPSNPSGDGGRLPSTPPARAVAATLRLIGRRPTQRMEKHCENAMKVATHLSKHPKIEWVRYPGLSRDPMHRLQKTYLKGKGGPLVVIGLKGGRAAGEKMINSLKLFSHVANVGDAKSLAIHPASTTHSQLSDEEQVL